MNSNNPMPAPALAPSLLDLAAIYRPPAGGFDELLEADGRPREHWRVFLDGLGRLDPEEQQRRWREAQHLLHSNGVSYNVYGDPRGLERPWSLSPFPVVIDPHDWAGLAAAIAQRNQLLDRLCADLFGPQRSLAEGLVPAELVLSHPGFLRPVFGVAPPGGRWIPLYAVDVLRTSDGTWRALADRTQAPTGAGYALENRIVVSRALPDLFRSCNVERLAQFFRRSQQALAELAPQKERAPRVVILTPGPYTATYFEQAYLATYLGYTLVTGGDLTVRGDRVFLKTLGGLQPVDVIVRRVNDTYCDPLELRDDSVLGIPGLCEVVRQGNVAVANPLGASLVQTPAFLGYLPALCRFFLGQELRLPSVESHWCGDRRALPEVLARFDQLVLKPAFDGGEGRPIFVSRLSAAEREAVRARVLAQPAAWVAQAELVPSTTPTLEGERWMPRSLILRGYAAFGTEDPVVMPGALARVARNPDDPEVSIQAGAGSKDTWVEALGQVDTFSLLPPPSAPVVIHRGTGDLPSRTGDNLYWVGRYAERTEGVVRLLRAVAGVIQAAPMGDVLAPGHELDTLMGAVFRFTGSNTPNTPSPDSSLIPHALFRAERELVAVVFDPACPGSLVSLWQRVLGVARQVRDRLSADSWRVLAALGDEVERQSDAASRLSLGAAIGLLDRVLLMLSAFSGIAQESMTRGHAWRLLDVGRRLERSWMLTRLLDATLVQARPREPMVLEAVLDIADSGITYRRRYLAELGLPPVLDLLLGDETNPRSLHFQARALAEHLWALPPDPEGGLRQVESDLMSRVIRKVTTLDLFSLDLVEADGRRLLLERLLGELDRDLSALSDQLSTGYLHHAAVSRHLAGEGEGA